MSCALYIVAIKGHKSKRFCFLLSQAHRQFFLPSLAMSVYIVQGTMWLDFLSMSSAAHEINFLKSPKAHQKCDQLQTVFVGSQGKWHPMDMGILKLLLYVEYTNPCTQIL